MKQQKKAFLNCEQFYFQIFGFSIPSFSMIFKQFYHELESINLHLNKVSESIEKILSRYLMKLIPQPFVINYWDSLWMWLCLVSLQLMLNWIYCRMDRNFIIIISIKLYIMPFGNWSFQVIVFHFGFMFFQYIYVIYTKPHIYGIICLNPNQHQPHLIACRKPFLCVSISFVLFLF